MSALRYARTGAAAIHNLRGVYGVWEAPMSREIMRADWDSEIKPTLRVALELGHKRAFVGGRWWEFRLLGPA